MSSIQALETRCNTDELNLSAKLQSLDAVKNTNGVKVTEATYDSDIDDFTGLGELTITDGAGGGTAGDAYILTVRTKVSFSRP